MSNPKDIVAKKYVEASQNGIPVSTAPLAVDVKIRTRTEMETEMVFDLTGIMRRWRREDTLKKGSLALRAAGCCSFYFLLLSCLTTNMVIEKTLTNVKNIGNKQGDWIFL